MKHSWKPELGSDRAFYIQVADQIRSLIASGYYAGGDKISERDIAYKFNVSRNTVTRAFSILRDYGLIESVEKSFTIISTDAANLARGTDWDKFLMRSQHQNKKEEVRRFIQSNLDNQTTLNVWSANNQEFGTIEVYREVFRKVALADIDSFFYLQIAQGLPQLRTEILEYLKLNDISAAVDDVFSFVSWQEALGCLAATIFSHNTIVFLAEYDMIDGYMQFSYTPAAVCPVKTDDEGIIPSAFVEKLRRYKGKDRILYIQPVNHIPTGRTMTERRMLELLAICRNEHIPIIENDILRDVTVFKPPKPLRSLESSLVINLGATGLFSQVGIKCAWLVMPEKLRYKMAEVKMHMCGGNHPFEIAAYMLFKDGYYADVVKRTKAQCAARNELINAALHEHLEPYAKWNDRDSVYRLITFNDGVNVSEEAVHHIGFFEFINIFSLRQHVVLDLISHTVEDLIDKIIYIKNNIEL